MPNWCSTFITFRGERNDVEKLHHIIDDCTKVEATKNSWNGDWLGNILINSGMYNVDDIDSKPHPACRGSITYVDNVHLDRENKYVFNVYTETAWEPMLQVWTELIDYHELGVEIIYTATEEGCEIYYTNDPYVEDKYVVIWDDDSEWDIDKNYATKLVGEILGCTNCNNIEMLMDMYENGEFDDVWISVHKYEYVPIDELS